MACHWVALDDRCQWNLHHGGSLTLLEALPDACMDALVTDPPPDRIRPPKRSSRVEVLTLDLDQTRSDWIREAERALRPGAAFVVLTDEARIDRYADAVGEAGLEDVRNVAGRALYARKPGPDPRWSGLQPQGFASLLDRLIGSLVPRDGFVLDPFAGSGAVGSSALRLGRRFFGAEPNAKLYRTACEAFARAVNERRRHDRN